MKRAFGLIALLSLLAAGCSSGGSAPVNTQEAFGVRMARMNLWREAMFRFERAVEMTPDDAMAHNNLAVACEANGDFEKAARQYREAMRLDKSNQYIQKNYSRFVEFTSRNRKRERKEAPAAAAGATASAPAEGASPVAAAPTGEAASVPAVPDLGAAPTATPPPVAPPSTAPAQTPTPEPATPTPVPTTSNPPGGPS